MASFITTLNASLLPSSSSIPLRRSNTRLDICSSFFSSSSSQPSLLSSSSSSSSQPSSGFSQFRTTQQNYLQKQQQHYNINKRGLLMVTRAAPTTANLIFAFVFPLGLILVTVFASLKIADKLDQDYIEELAINQAIMEGKDEDGKSPTLPVEEKPALPRTRNRPKRQA